MKIHAVAPVSASKTADLPDDQEAPDPPAATAVLVTVVVDALTQATTETVSASVTPAASGERGTRTVEVKVEVRHTAASEEPRHSTPAHAPPPPAKAPPTRSPPPTVQPKVAAFKSGTRGVRGGAAVEGDEGADDGLIDDLVIQLAADLNAMQPVKLRGRGRRSGRVSGSDGGVGIDGIDGVDGVDNGEGLDRIVDIPAFLMPVVVPKVPDASEAPLDRVEGLADGDFADAGAGSDDILVTYYRPPLHNRRLETNGVDDALLLLVASVQDDLPRLRSPGDGVLPVIEPIEIDAFQKTPGHEEPLAEAQATDTLNWYPDRAVTWACTVAARAVVSAGRAGAGRRSLRRHFRIHQSSDPRSQGVVERAAFWVRADTCAPAAAIAQRRPTYPRARVRCAAAAGCGASSAFKPVAGAIAAPWHPLCDDIGLGLTTWSPLASGLLTGKYRTGIPADSRATMAGMDFLFDGLTDAGRNAALAKLEGIAVSPRQTRLEMAY
jgi:hypothetical protein